MDNLAVLFLGLVVYALINTCMAITAGCDGRERGMNGPAVFVLVVVILLFSYPAFALWGQFTRE